ncbi:MAG: cob(I)yrinic acid a,c-diamide adenosyltransferase [Arenicellales bacterium WSBS_2016_MAG_OTU3]
MGNRLSKIYTRTGDGGTTGLSDGSRVAKDDVRVETIGDIDELNCVVGLLLSNDLPDDISATLTDVQHALFDLGGELSMPGYTTITAQQVASLEQILDALNDDLQPLKEFILPGGSLASAHCHIARSTCRRAERRLHTLAKQTDVNEQSTRYLNRLSDLLFVMCRTLNKAVGVDDVLWKHERKRKPR